MGRLIKIALIVFAAVAALVVIAAVSFMLFFDPNDFREKIADQVEQQTGRELVIEGDLEVSLFPWLAIGVGKSTLGNAPGFGDEPFASFEQARLSVRLMPMLLRRDVSVGTATLDSLQVNLVVKRDGSNNWEDLVDAEEATPGDGGRATLDIASIDINNASLSYRDLQLGETYLITNANLKSGRISSADSVPISGSLSFELQPDAVSGTIDVESVVSFDTDAATITFDDLEFSGPVEGLASVPTELQFRTDRLQANTDTETVTLEPVEISVLGLDIRADVEPFSFAGAIEPVAKVQVDAFSPRSLMRRLNIEVPPTADPNALGKAILDATVLMATDAYVITRAKLVIDETKLSGDLTVPVAADGRYTFELEADKIDLNRYMAPADESGSARADESPVEIPVDLIRPLNISGVLSVVEADLGGIRFEQVDVIVAAANGKLRFYPFSAKLFDGTYKGDVRIDVSGARPVLSVDENVTGVQLGSLAQAMFEQKNVTGTISGSFKLSGQGDDLGAIQRNLSGSMNFQLVDGAFEGTDVWYELRRARALFKQQPAPKPVLPARTKFSSVTASGPVSGGIFKNDQVRADLPFMQITGSGTVDLAEAKMDYRLSARVLEKPELVEAATPEELKEFTEAVIPLRISGPLTSPSIKPDIEGMLKKRVKEEVEKQLLDKLLGGRKKDRATPDAEPAQEPAPGDAAEQAQPDAEPPKEKSAEDEIKDALKDIFKR